MKTYQKNETADVIIKDLSQDGEGIGKTVEPSGDGAGYTVFVKGALPGDRIRAKITKAGKRFGYGRIEQIITASPDRTQPFCPIAGPCGGCQLQALRYDAQLSFKEKKVKNDLARIGGFEEEEIDRVFLPAIGMEQAEKAGEHGACRYRNKMQVPVTGPEYRAGFYAGRTHAVIPLPDGDCRISAPEGKEILEGILRFVKKHRIAPYQEQDGSGLLRHVLIRTAKGGQRILVCLVVNGSKLPGEKELVTSLRGLPETGARIVSISLNINTARNNVILGEKVRLLWGEEYLEDELMGLRFRISAQSFYQVNPIQTEKLYAEAVCRAGLTGTETVWDLYCGTGTISLCMASELRRQAETRGIPVDECGKVYGVEIIPQAVDNARENAKLNGLSETTRFECGRAEEIVPAMQQGARDAFPAPDVIVVDPPRKGLDEACLNSMLDAAPARIVYVSCDPATLARDLKLLTAGGYELLSVQPVDMFPETVHVETVVLMSRIKEK